MHQDAAVSRTQDDDVLAAVHRHLRDCHIAATPHGFKQQAISFLAGRLRRHVIRPLKVDRINFTGLYELQHFHNPGAGRSGLFDLAFLNDHVLAALVLKAFDQFVAADGLVLGLRR